MNTIAGLVSVIMPNYNCGAYISESIESVLSQSYPNWELIVVDDCSSDNSAEIVRAFCSACPKIHLVELAENTGASNARNKGISLAQGEYIAFLDSDDIWLPEKLSMQVQFMKENSYAFSCASYAVISEDGASKGVVKRPPRSVGYHRLLYLGDSIGNSTAIYSQRMLRKCYAPSIKKRNDYALWLSILRVNGVKVYGLREVVANYRVREGSLSSGKRNLPKWQWHLYREIEHLSIASAALAFVIWAITKSIGYGVDKLLELHFSKSGASKVE